MTKYIEMYDAAKGVSDIESIIPTVSNSNIVSYPNSDELMSLLGYSPKDIIGYLFQVVLHGYTDYFDKFTDMHQILFACVMKEKYKMYWNEDNKNWIKFDESLYSKNIKDYETF